MDPTTNDPTNINPVPGVTPDPSVEPASVPGTDQPVTPPAPTPEINSFPGDATPAEIATVGSTITPTEPAPPLALDPISPALEPTTTADSITPSEEVAASPVENATNPSDPVETSTPDANQQLGSF